MSLMIWVNKKRLFRNFLNKKWVLKKKKQLTKRRFILYPVEVGSTRAQLQSKRGNVKNWQMMVEMLKSTWVFFIEPRRERTELKKKSGGNISLRKHNVKILRLEIVREIGRGNWMFL